MEIKRGHYSTNEAVLGSLDTFLEKNKNIIEKLGNDSKEIFRHDDLVIYLRNVLIVLCILNTLNEQKKSTLGMDVLVTDRMPDVPVIKNLDQPHFL